MTMPSSRHLVDPELLPGLDLIPKVHFSLDTLPAVRKQMAEFTARRDAPEVPGVATEQRLIRASEGHDVPVLVHRPDGLPVASPALIYAHGGGFLLGSAAAMKPANQQMARDAQCLIVLVDYRLPPETPYPRPLKDCYTALLWLHSNAGELGVDRDRIAVAGESAGGGLAAALALLARDRGEVPLVHQHLTYPMLDDRTCRDTANPFAGEFVWSPEDNQLGWSSLLGRPAGADDTPGYVAPARATDLSGLPSTYIPVGALDLFADEDLAYARRLMRAGVATELHPDPGAYHGFELAAGAAVTRAAHQSSINALKRALSPR
jgi:acetyl esterase/lipase